MLRINAGRADPFAQHILMEIKITGPCATATPRCLTASSLNSGLNFLLVACTGTMGRAQPDHGSASTCRTKGHGQGQGQGQGRATGNLTNAQDVSTSTREGLMEWQGSWPRRPSCWRSPRSSPPRISNRGKSGGVWARRSAVGVQRAARRTGSGGILLPGMPRRSPRQSQKLTPSLLQVFIMLSMVSRAARPWSLWVPPLILRRVTTLRISFSEPLVWSGMSGRWRIFRKLWRSVRMRASRRSRSRTWSSCRRSGRTAGPVPWLFGASDPDTTP